MRWDQLCAEFAMARICAMPQRKRRKQFPKQVKVAILKIHINFLLFKDGLAIPLMGTFAILMVAIFTPIFGTLL